MKLKNYLNILEGIFQKIYKIKSNYRYKPLNIENKSKLKPFIPDYIPSVGEVDAFLKMERPNKDEEVLGLSVLVTFKIY